MSNNAGVSNNNPLSFFEDFFPEGFNVMYDEFLNLEKKLSEDNLKLIKEHIKEHDQDLRSKIKSMDDVYKITETYEVPYYDAPPQKINVIDYNFDEDIMTIEECDYIFLEDDLSYYIHSKKQYKRVFFDELQTLLDSEIRKTTKATNDTISQPNTIESQKLFIHTLLRTATYIIDKKIPFIDRKTYIPQCQKLLISYIQEIENRYPDSISREKSLYLRYLTKKNPKKECSLEIVASKFNRLQVLLDLLKADGFVEQDLKLEEFEQAFNGRELTKPLEIKWTKMYYGKCNYTAVLEMIQQMENKKYLTGGYRYPQLSLIFVRNDGTTIKEDNWKEANSRKKKEKKTNKYTPSDDIKVIVNNF